MTGDDRDDMFIAREAVADARREAAVAQARLAEAAVRFADVRIAGDTRGGLDMKPGRGRSISKRTIISPTTKCLDRTCRYYPTHVR